jgi:hypothetical protein
LRLTACPGCRAGLGAGGLPDRLVIGSFLAAVRLLIASCPDLCSACVQQRGCNEKVRAAFFPRGVAQLFLRLVQAATVVSSRTTSKNRRQMRKSPPVGGLSGFHIPTMMPVT